MPFVFKAVELCVVNISEDPWTGAKEMCRVLEYGTSKTANIIRAHCSPENITQKYQMMGLVSETRLVNWPTGSQKYEIYINELFVGSQQPLAKKLAEYMGIKII